MVDAKQDILSKTLEHEEKCRGVIRDACSAGRIDDTAREYMETLYTNSMDLCREVFLYIGKCFGAPKAPVRAYDFETDSIINKPITISEINPLATYLVNHRLDTDPMRNQFFVATSGHKIDLAVSSIVSVIVGAQKNVYRAIDKVTNKYYPKYIGEVIDVVQRIFEKNNEMEAGEKIVAQIRDLFERKFISDASVAVLEMLGRGHQKVATELVRELDKIVPPHKRLRDVWRIKCLFDLVPQARTFIDYICNAWPEKVIDVRDKFFDISNPRGYRDAKLILNIGTDGKIIPMEIICQVRTFFEFEHKTHTEYEHVRKDDKEKEIAEIKTEILHTAGVKKYNDMICDCVSDLFDRIGWNILYSDGNEDMLFEGFPRFTPIYYPNNITDIIFKKVDSAVENEIFFVENAPLKLNKDQTIRIFRWMAKFILVTAMPYSDSDWSVPTDTMAGKFFSFVMQELLRQYKK